MRGLRRVRTATPPTADELPQVGFGAVTLGQLAVRQGIGGAMWSYRMEDRAVGVEPLSGFAGAGPGTAGLEALTGPFVRPALAVSVRLLLDDWPAPHEARAGFEDAVSPQIFGVPGGAVNPPTA